MGILAIKSKEELTKELKSYKGDLTKELINYLNSLINLEFSVVKNHISEEERKRLSDITLYREIAAYNIERMALNVFGGIKLSDGLEVAVSIGNKKDKQVNMEKELHISL